MSTSEDPNLLELFSQAEQDFQDDSFAEDVLQQIDRERRKTLLLWFALFVLALAGDCCLFRWLRSRPNGCGSCCRQSTVWQLQLPSLHSAFASSSAGSCASSHSSSSLRTSQN